MAGFLPGLGRGGTTHVLVVRIEGVSNTADIEDVVDDGDGKGDHDGKGVTEIDGCRVCGSCNSYLG